MENTRDDNWDTILLAIEAKERPSVIGSMLFKLLEDAGYSIEDIRVIADTMTNYAN